MTRVFISHAACDVFVARRLSTALEETGLASARMASFAYRRGLLTGIENASAYVAGADAVLVYLSSEGIASGAVRSETHFAAVSDKLIIPIVSAGMEVFFSSWCRSLVNPIFAQLDTPDWWRVVAEGLRQRLRRGARGGSGVALDPDKAYRFSSPQYADGRIREKSMRSLLRRARLDPRHSLDCVALFDQSVATYVARRPLRRSGGATPMGAIQLDGNAFEDDRTLYDISLEHLNDKQVVNGKIGGPVFSFVDAEILSWLTAQKAAMVQVNLYARENVPGADRVQNHALSLIAPNGRQFTFAAPSAYDLGGSGAAASTQLRAPERFFVGSVVEAGDHFTLGAVDSAPAAQQAEDTPPARLAPLKVVRLTQAKSPPKKPGAARQFAGLLRGVARILFLWKN